MGTMCEEGYCDCSFHKPNMKHPGNCDCAGCAQDEAAGRLKSLAPPKPHPEHCECKKCVAEWANQLAEDLIQVGEAEYDGKVIHNPPPDPKNVVSLNDYQTLAGVTANQDMLSQILVKCGFSENLLSLVMSVPEAQKLQQRIDVAVLSLGITGEAGEVADLIKKHVGHDHDLDRNKVKKELGDVLWYVAVLANSLGISLQEVAQGNIDKLAARYPNGFNVEQSKNRKVSDV